MPFEKFIQNASKLVEQTIERHYDMGDNGEGIFIGTYEPSFDPTVIVNSMNVWCTQVDKLIKLANELDPSGMSERHKKLLKLRGFTYGEYYYLFKDDLDEKDFFTSPAHKFLAVYTKDHLQKKLEGYSMNPEDFTRFILQSNLIPSRFFLRKLSAYVPYKDLIKHAYIPARTGHGKSEILKLLFYNLTIRSQKKNSFSLILLDPHGDISNEVIRWKQFKNNDRLIYICPKLKEGYTPRINPLELENPNTENVTNAVGFFITALEEVLQREGNRLTEPMVDMLEKCLYFLLYRGNCSLADLIDLLYLDENILSDAIAHNRYFETAFAKAKMTRDSLRSRIGRLLNNPYLREFVVGKSTFDIEHAMNSGKVIVFNFGHLDEMSQEAFGKFVLARMKSIARRRSESNRIPTFVFIDECQNFISKSIEYTLSQLRKFGLHMILSNQYLRQLDGYQDVVKSQTLVKIVGATDHDNAKNLASNLGVKEEEIINLPIYNFIIKSASNQPIKIKTVDSLVFSKRSNKYYVNEKDASELKEKQLNKYYVPLSSQPTEVKQPLTKPTSKSNPPYGLYLGEDDTTDQ